MFKENGIPVKTTQLERLFRIIDEDGGGSLDLDEFKQFTLSEEANFRFRKII
jgi:Ca2+-binding EF-hand superfamily protein